MRKRQYIKKAQRQKSYNEIVALVKAEFDKCKDDELDNGDDENFESYEGTEASSVNEERILMRLRDELGWDYEEDNVHMDYCMKATLREIWEYTLNTTLPKIRRRLKLDESPLEILGKGADVGNFGDPVE